MSWRDYPPYVPVAERRAKGAKAAKRLRKGRVLQPVVIEGRGIARTFWGKAWCANLEAYSDYANRLPRGRTYARNGSVVDLSIQGGRVDALVSGSELYEVSVTLAALPPARWEAIRAACAGQIDSVVELLAGRLSKGVMDVVTRKGTGLFPKPDELGLKCSCPDWATMCKHVAATLYGVGARLDEAPELLFTLRGVDANALVEDVVAGALAAPGSASADALVADDLSALFGIDLEEEVAAPAGDLDARVLRAVLASPGSAKRDLAAALGLPAAALTPALRRLVVGGKVRHVGPRNGGGYEGSGR